MLTTPKTRKCKVCRQDYAPKLPMQRVCGQECALTLAKSKRAAEQKVLQVKERRADKVKRESQKTRGDWIKEAQIEFNKYVRFRDAGRGCISCGSACGESSIGGGGDAGHFRSRGSAPHLRFDERNCHLQCKKCNRYLSGNVVDYRTGLIDRLGINAVVELEADQTPRKYTVDELKAIKKHNAELAKQLKDQS